VKVGITRREEAKNKEGGEKRERAPGEKKYASNKKKKTGKKMVGVVQGVGPIEWGAKVKTSRGGSHIAFLEKRVVFRGGVAGLIGLKKGKKPT